MSLDYQTNKLSAQRAASGNVVLYQSASQKFGKLLSQYRKDIPLSLCLGHVVRVNPRLDSSPSNLGSSFKRGFIFASTSVAREAGFSSADLDDSEFAAYIWCKEVNRLAKALQTAHSRSFSSAGVDFWKSVYLKHVLGDSPFDQLWTESNPSTYSDLIQAIEDRKTALTPWTLTNLKKVAFFDCEYVYAFARNNGILSSSGFGSTPTLKKSVVLS